MAKADLEVMAQIAAHPNLASELDERTLQRIGSDVLEHYNLDLDSMADWRRRMDRGLKLASLIKDDRNYPFENASNVKYPLITQAALQFNARAYPAIVSSDQVVRVRKHGEDATGAKAARAKRIERHMSYKLSAEVEEWEAETDKLLVQLPIVGTVTRKVWFDPVAGRMRCRLVDPSAWVLNDKVKVLADAPRVSEELSLYPYEIVSRMKAGQYVTDEYTEDDDEDQAPEIFIEQHCRLDLDEDGYDEPYIVTVHKRSQKVARIVADFDAEAVRVNQAGEVIDIPRGTYFIDYQFLPSMDGGFFGTGLGLLLGDISDTINSIINMMLDAGHMASLGGGFIGSDFRIRGGSQRFKPGEWKTTKNTGPDIRNSIVPMSFPGPDATLFQLLGLMIDSAKDVASVKDIMTGETGGKNMTATTTIALIEQGMMVFTAAYKRIFRSLKREFGLMADILAKTTSIEEYSAFHDLRDPETGQVVPIDPAFDYSMTDMDVEPVADPRSVTRMQEAAKAEFIMQMARDGLVDIGEASQRILEVMSVDNVDELAPKPNPAQEQMAQMQMMLEAKKVEADQAKAQADGVKAQAEMIKAQTPVDNSADMAKAQTQERIKLAELEAKMQMEREKLAADMSIEREKIVADLQARQLEMQAQIAQASAGAEGAAPQVDMTPFVEAFAALIDTIKQQNDTQLAMMNAPKRVVRDDAGNVVGVETVVN